MANRRFGKVDAQTLLLTKKTLSTTAPTGLVELAPDADGNLWSIDDAGVTKRVGVSKMETPTAVSPTEGSTAGGVSVPIEASEYTAIYDKYTHASSDWEVLDSGDNVVFSSTDDTTNLTSITATGLTISTAYKWRVRYKDSTGEYSQWSTYTNFTTGIASIDAPTFVYPTGTPTNVDFGTEFEIGAFSVTGGTDTHTHTQWQIATDSGFSAIVYETGDDDTNKLTIPLPPEEFSTTTTYFARARYKGQTYGYGAWSSAEEFTTAATIVGIATPTITYPTEGLTDVNFSSPFVANPFNLIGGTDSHVSTDWEITTLADTEFISPVFQSLDDTANLETINIDFNYFTNSTDYRVRVRYKGSTYTSGYDVKTFTTSTSLTGSLGVYVYGQEIAQGTPVVMYEESGVAKVKKMERVNDITLSVPSLDVGNNYDSASVLNTYDTINDRFIFYANGLKEMTVLPSGHQSVSDVNMTYLTASSVQQLTYDDKSGRIVMIVDSYLVVGQIYNSYFVPDIEYDITSIFSSSSASNLNGLLEPMSGGRILVMSGSGNNVQVRICTLYKNYLTLGPEATVTTEAQSESGHAYKSFCISYAADLNKIAVIYPKTLNNYPYIKIGEIVGDTMTFGPELWLPSADNWSDPAVNKVKYHPGFQRFVGMIGYIESDQQTYGIILSVSGTTPTLVYSANVGTQQINPLTFDFDIVGNTMYIIHQHSPALGFYAISVRTATISANSLSFSAASDTGIAINNNNNNYYNSYLAVAINYSARADAIHIIVNGEPFFVSRLWSSSFQLFDYQTEDFIGVAQAAGTTGSSKAVALLGDVSKVHSGTPGEKVYLDWKGELTSTNTGNLVGRYISDTDILLVNK